VAGFDLKSTFCFLTNLFCSEELFFQIILNEFCNIGQLKLSTPLSIKDCLTIALEVEEKNGNLPGDMVSLDQIIKVNKSPSF
jgi:DNA mismatch repair protein MLH1